VKARSECTLKKSTKENKGNPEQKFDAAFGSFQEASKSLKLIFLWNKAG
jgi:hypothetical protein